MPFPPPPELLEAAREAARAGAMRLMEYWRSLEPSEIHEKARNDLVTAADRASEEAVVTVLRDRFPTSTVLAEESGLSGGPEGGGLTWIVDPLDGTTNFVHGFPHFAVSVAAAAGDRLLAGVILDPVKGDLFAAAEGAGATWNGRPCRVGTRKGLAGAFLATGFPFKAHRLLDPYLAIFHDLFLEAKAIRRPGAAALDLAYVAAGIFDGFFEFQLAPWDLAAGVLMVREAGGVVTDMEGGGRFLESGDVIAGVPAVQGEMLRVVARHRPAWRPSRGTSGERGILAPGER